MSPPTYTLISNGPPLSVHFSCMYLCDEDVKSFQLKDIVLLYHQLLAAFNINFLFLCTVSKCF